MLKLIKTRENPHDLTRDILINNFFFIRTLQSFDYRRHTEENHRRRTLRRLSFLTFFSRRNCKHTSIDPTISQSINRFSLSSLQNL
ncbi:hypothetical protein QVD17_08008 [Tagetes erecta]|uniref:Uncharacterized protein n=1 Tax=Tagetes erecta TaxID=13708 RepID=A0AAD8KZ04_TARER|nr:hypothetical protein QVD17_08008 [Tagetes erecta]